MRFHLLALSLLCVTAYAARTPALNVTVDEGTGGYSVTLDGVLWYSSPSGPAAACLAGTLQQLQFAGLARVEGKARAGLSRNGGVIEAPRPSLFAACFGYFMRILLLT